MPSKRSATNMTRLETRSRRLRLEPLEERRLLVFDPSALEQEMLEDINRMRINPQNELNVIFTSFSPLTSSDPEVTSAVRFFNVNAAQLQAEFAALTPVAPVAWAEGLLNAAEAHSAAMIAANDQQHQLPGEPGLGSRAIAGGYTNYSGLGENIFAYSKSVFYGHAGFAVDWGNTTPGHRDNIMSANWQEIGIDVTPTSNPNPPFGDVGPLVVTQDFGSRFNYGNPQLLGVVFGDANSNALYNAGEGRAGVTITATPVGGGAAIMTTTMSAGGYQMHLPAGTYNVTASGGGLSSPMTFTNVVVSSANRKVDFNSAVAMNLPPVNTVPSAQSVFTNGSLTFSSATGNAISIADPDAGNNPLAVTLTVSGGTMTLANTSVTFYNGDGVNDNVIVFGGTAAAINAALNGLRFTPPGTAQAVTLTITTSDLGFTGAGGTQTDTDTVTINVATPPNTAPVNSMPGTQATQVNAAMVFNTANGNAISVNDADAGSNPLRVTLTAASGRMTLSQLTGLSFSAGDGTLDTTMTFSGTIAAINAALAGSTFVPNNGFAGNASLTIVTNDQGFSGTGGALTDTDAITIQVNQPVEVSGSTVTLTGSTAADNVAITFNSATSYSIRLNGSTTTYNTGTVSNIRFALGGGGDTVTAYLSAGSDTVIAGPSTLNVTGTGYTILGSGGNTQYVFANGSAGTVQLLDTSGADTFVGLGTNNILYGAGYLNQVLDITTAYAYSSGGSDTALFYDSSGADYFYGLPSTSVMINSNSFAQAVGFRAAYATASAGVDTALLYDAATNDTFYGLPTYSLIITPTNVAQATGFDAAYGMGLGGGVDTAVLFDSTGTDSFSGTSTLSVLIGTGYSNVAYLFEAVYVYGTSGGTNVASITDSAGSDTLTATGNQFILLYPSAAIVLVAFTHVTADRVSGGSDTRHVASIDYALATGGGWISV